MSDAESDANENYLSSDVAESESLDEFLQQFVPGAQREKKRNRVDSSEQSSSDDDNNSQSANDADDVQNEGSETVDDISSSGSPDSSHGTGVYVSRNGIN